MDEVGLTPCFSFCQPIPLTAIYCIQYTVSDCVSLLSDFLFLRQHSCPLLLTDSVKSLDHLLICLLISMSGRMFIFNGELRSMDSVQCVKMLSLEIGGCPLHTGKEQMRQGKVKSNTLIIIDGDSLWCLHTLAPCSSSITQMIAHARKALLCLQVRMLWEVCTPVVSLTALATPTTRSKEETRADLRRCFRTHSAHVGGEVPPAGRIIQMM